MIPDKALTTTLFTAAGILLVSVALATIGYLAFLPKLQPEFAPYISQAGAKPYRIEGSNFRRIFGTMNQNDGASIVTAMEQDDRAMMARKVYLNADALPFLSYQMEGLHPGFKPHIFWRRQDQPDELYQQPLYNSGSALTFFNLSKNENWTGKITEVGVFALGGLRGSSWTVKQIGLEPYTKLNLLQTIWDEWTAFSPWQQHTIHAYRGAVKEPILFPTVAGMVVILLAIGVTGVMSGLSRVTNLAIIDSRSAYISVLIVCGACWLALDVLWQKQLIQQTRETRYLFAGKTHHEKLLADWDGEYYAFAKEIVDNYLPERLDHIPLLAVPNVPKAYGFRLGYHLLPDHRLNISHHSWPGAGSNELTVMSDQRFQRASREPYLIVITGPSTDANAGNLFDISDVSVDTNIELVYANNAAALYKVLPEND